MAALRAVVPYVSKSSVAAVSRCCKAARRATRAAGVVGDHPAIRRRFMSSAIVDDNHFTGFPAYADDDHVSVFPAYVDELRSKGTLDSTFAFTAGAGSGQNKEDSTGPNPGPSTPVNLQKALEMLAELKLDESEKTIFLKEVGKKYNLYKSPAEVAKGIRSMDLKTIPEMTWLLEALYVKCGPWIYVIDHQLKKRGIKEQPDFTLDEYEKSPSELRTELKLDELVKSQKLSHKVLIDMSKFLSSMEKPAVPMFSITIGGRTIDFGDILWKWFSASSGNGISRFR